MTDPTWTDLAESGDVAPGAVRSVEVGDRDLVAWRGLGGRVCVMAARCPHEWSHLGAEGVVDGDEIVCTAHYWRFDRRGQGTKLNVKGRRDLKADIETLPSREIDGRIEVDLTGRSG